jgi:hypothetical protein
MFQQCKMAFVLCAQVVVSSSSAQFVCAQMCEPPFFYSSAFEVGDNPDLIKAGDLDGDQDLVLNHFTTDTFDVFINRCIELEICVPDLTNDGVLDIFDVPLFVQLYSEGDPSTDFNADGSLNFFDVTEFILAFQAGCP